MMVRRAVFAGFVLALTAGCADTDYTRLYKTSPKPAEWTDEEISGLEHPGPTMLEKGVNFGVFSARAERVEVLLFDDPESPRPAKRFPMVKFGDVWNLYVEGVGAGQHYGYVAWGPNWTYDADWYPGSVKGFLADVDAQGNRFNPNKLLIDPYAKSIHRDHDWSKGSAASGPARNQSTWAAAPKGVVVVSDYTWSANELDWRLGRQANDLAGHDWNQTILYEVHPKGFTAETASGVDHPGTYRGVGEKAAYLQDLGITAVELLPVHEKPVDGGYWGYWSLSYFAPENTYAFTQDPNEILDEFKFMVDELHKHDIEVILDVVYNHTGEGGLWRERIYQDDISVDPATNSSNLDPKEVASVQMYRGLDNASYYALNPGNQTYWNNTGVGHQTRPNNTPMRKLIMDSLRFYVEELHVDGFRFDLAGILGEIDGDYNNWDDPANTVLQEIADDPVLQQYNTRIIAEPWTAGGYYGALIGAYPASSTKAGTGFGEWNAHFRDVWRSIANNDAWELNTLEGTLDLGGSLTGSEVSYGWNGRNPYHTVNFVTSHDGFTMYDLVSYDTKVNGCSPLNPVCCTAPASPWCEFDSGENNNRSRNWGSDAAGEAFKRQQMRNLFAAMLVSHGTPMILGGDEWMRTQLGNNNAYSSGADNAYNWFRWGDWQGSDEKHRMHDFVRDTIAFRKAHEYAFAPKEYGDFAPYWKNPSNVDMQPADWDGRALMAHYFPDPSVGQEILVIFNFVRTDVTFTLPGGRVWRRVLDTQSYFDDAYITANALDARTSWNVAIDAPELIATPDYVAKGTSIVVFKADP